MKFLRFFYATINLDTPLLLLSFHSSILTYGKIYSSTTSIICFLVSFYFLFLHFPHLWAQCVYLHRLFFAFSVNFNSCTIFTRKRISRNKFSISSSHFRSCIVPTIQPPILSHVFSVQSACVLKSTAYMNSYSWIQQGRKKN